MRHPSPLLAFDETLYWYLGHIGVQQYNPNKPAKYGLLYRNLCDSSIPYTCYILPYAGKPENIDGAGAKYCLTRTDEYSKYLINKLPVYCDLQGINISMDCYFTSVSLATSALKRNITIVGTMKQDRKSIPKEWMSVADREERSVTHVCSKKQKIMLVSYIDKKNSGTKNVILLSAMHDNVKIKKDQRKKLSVHTMYDYTGCRCCQSFVNNTFNTNKI